MKAIHENGVKSIVLIGRTWFSSRKGRSLMSARIIVDGQSVAYMTHLKGHSNDCEWAAIVELQRLGIAADRQESESLYSWCVRHKIALFASISQVKAKSWL